MQLGFLPQIEFFTLKGIRFTVDPLFPVIILFLFWQYIMAGAFAIALAGFAAFTLLILWHEMGHAIIARFCGAEVYSVNLHWFGGSCQHRKVNSKNKEVLIASGGIFAQAILALIAFSVSLILPVTTPVAAVVLYTLIKTNLIIMALNLLPVPSFDGGRIFAYLKERFWK